MLRLLEFAVIFGIVRQSGGEIEVESALGRGTAFRVYLPYAQGPADDTGADNDKAAPTRGSETVLVVDDDGAHLHLSARVLMKSGYTVLKASSGPEALKLLEQHGKPVDLLLTDVVMAGMNGRKLALEVARRRMAARTLYISGHAIIAKHKIAEPGLTFLYKPFTREELLRKVRSVLDGPADLAKA